MQINLNPAYLLLLFTSVIALVMTDKFQKNDLSGQFSSTLLFKDRQNGHGNNQQPLSIPLSGSQKGAYKNHFKGTLYYQEGNFKKALQHFGRAHNVADDNFYFGLSYAICLAQVGKVDKSLEVLRGCHENLDELSEDYRKQVALLSFFEGMANIYAERFHVAVQALSRAVEEQEKLGNDRITSLLYNALGYATLLNQGKGAHIRADIAAHYHIHTRDMLRARAFFEKAVAKNRANAAAWHNYRIISDSLDLAPVITFDSTSIYDDFFGASASSLTNLPQSILSAFDLYTYKEVLLMLDISGSMVQEKVQCQDTTRFAIMKETALRLVNNIPDTVKMGIGTIGGDCPEEPRLWHKVDALSHRDLQYAVEFLVPNGTTPLLTMLQRSPELFSKNPNTEKVIFLVSDGANICSGGGVDICEWVEKLARKKVTIHILTFLNASFSNTNAFAEYTCLADKTNGDIFYLDDLRCNVRPHPTTLVQACQPSIPNLRRVDCWGDAFENLWAIFPGEEE